MATGWIETGLTPEETNFVELTPEEKLIQLSPEEGGPAPPLVEEDTEPAPEPTAVFEELIVIEATTTEEAIIATTTEESIIEVPITSTTTEEIAIEATTTEEVIIEESEIQADSQSGDN